MSNRQQILRTPDTGKIPLLANLLDGEFAANIPDQGLWLRLGNTLVDLCSPDFIVETAGKQFVSQTQIDAWDMVYTLPAATSTTLGGVKIGTNINVDAAGMISLDYADADTDGVLSQADWALFNGKQAALGFTPVNLDGDTMMGPLVLSADPVAPLQAASKQYIDNLLADKINLNGGTMTGPLVLNGDPTQGLGATTKQYVDTLVSNVSGHYGPAVQDLAELTAIAAATCPDKQMRLVENNGSIWRFDVQSVEVADGTTVVAPADSIGAGRWLKVQAATQNHNVLNGLQGGQNGDYLHLTTAEKNSYDSHLGDSDIHITLAQSTWIDSISATALEINYSVGLTGSIQDQLDGKQSSLGYTPVNQAGDTMTGLLILSGDAVNPLGAISKQQLENYTIDAGTF